MPCSRSSDFESFAPVGARTCGVKTRTALDERKAYRGRGGRPFPAVFEWQPSPVRSLNFDVDYGRFLTMDM